MTGGCLQDLSTGHCSQMHLPCTAHSKGAAQICSVVARNLLNRRVHNEIHNTEKPSEALLASFPGCSHVYLQYLITCSMQNEICGTSPFIFAYRKYQVGMA